MDIEIRALTPDDWELYREIRIRALEESPEAFKMRPEEAREQPAEFWIDTLDHEHWYVAFAFDAPIGLGGIKPLPEDDTQYEIVGVWIEPHYRGTGIFETLVKEGSEHCIRKGITQLYASIFTGNGHSKTACEHEGFSYIDTRASAYQPERTIDRLRRDLV